MSFAIATFYNDILDPFGMPIKFHRYFIVEDFLNDTYRSITITPLTEGTPRVKSSLIKKDANSESAIKYAFEELKKHPDMIHLKNRLSF